LFILIKEIEEHLKLVDISSFLIQRIKSKVAPRLLEKVQH